MRRPGQAWPLGSTRVAGIIGSDVTGSLSPAIQNAAFAAAGLDWAYAAFNVARGGGGAAVEAMRVLGIAGLSVTMPHKIDVIAELDDLTPDARATGAVNTIYRSGESLVGANTDVSGLIAGISASLGIELSGRCIAVIGAGGAGRAVVRAGCVEGASRISVVSRRGQMARQLAESSRSSDCADTEIESFELGSDEGSREIAAADVIVNATPVGSTVEGSPIDAELIGDRQFVYDLIYRPSETALIAAARAIGATAATGLEMLIAQAAEQFTLWTGEEAPTDSMRASADVALAETDSPK